MDFHVGLFRSVHSFQVFGKSAGILHVMGGRTLEELCRRFIHALHHFAWHTHHERIVGNSLPLWNERSCPDDTIFTDGDAIHNGCPHADQAVIADGAAMQHGLMSHGDIRTDGQRKPYVRVQHAQFLNVAASANRDWFIVATQNGTKPNVSVFMGNNLTHDLGIGRYPNGIMKVGRLIAEGINGHRLDLVFITVVQIKFQNRHVENLHTLSIAVIIVEHPEELVLFVNLR